jgi:predicted nucleotidyltransferase
MDVAKWLKANTVYITLAGSRAYGLAMPESDWDYRGACVMPADYYLGMYNFEQADSKGTIHLVKDLFGPKYPTDDAEISIWSLKKMISLAADGNPNMIELVFTDTDSIVHKHPLMDKFFAIKEAFLSQNLKHRFSGYAMQQLKRIRNHKRWIDNPPTRPTREQFGIEGVNMPKDQLHACDKLIEFQVESWLVDQTHLPEDIKIQLYPEVIRMINVILEQIQIEEKISRVREILDRAANRHLGFDADFINFLNAYKRYRSAKAEFQSYETWKAQRNPARAELERKWGYDSKHALHLVRLMRMCREILEKHEVHVSRTGIDAEELLAIRNGGTWPYEKLVSWAEEEDKALTDLMPKSGLPKSPNRKLISDVLTEVTFDYLSTP